MNLSWLFFSVLAWVGGYYATRFGLKPPLSPRVLLVRPPQWIFFLCGRPGASGLPVGVMALASVWWQMAGIIQLCYGILLYQHWLPYSLKGVELVWFGSLLLSGVSAYVLYRLRPYSL